MEEQSGIFPMLLEHILDAYAIKAIFCSESTNEPHRLSFPRRHSRANRKQNITSRSAQSLPSRENKNVVCSCISSHFRPWKRAERWNKSTWKSRRHFDWIFAAIFSSLDPKIPNKKLSPFIKTMSGKNRFNFKFQLIISISVFQVWAMANSNTFESVRRRSPLARAAWLSSIVPSKIEPVRCNGPKMASHSVRELKNLTV